jgi:hypothetical protein
LTQLPLTVEVHQLRFECLQLILRLLLLLLLLCVQPSS